MQKRTLPHIVAYDICSSKRLQRINRLLKGWGIPVQYSVFLCPLTARSRTQLIDELSRAMDSKFDDIRIYPLPVKPWIYQLGSGIDSMQLFGLTDGGFFSDLGSPVSESGNIDKPKNKSLNWKK